MIVNKPHNANTGCLSVISRPLINMPGNMCCKYCFINKLSKVTPLVYQSHDSEICMYKTILSEAEERRKVWPVFLSVQR